MAPVHLLQPAEREKVSMLAELDYAVVRLGR
jgi:hypothetical protein